MNIASTSESLKVWNADHLNNELALQSTHPSSSEFLCMSWNHTNQVVAVGGRDTKVHLVQANSGQLLSSLQLSETKLHNFKVAALSFSHNSRYLVTSIGTPLQLWDLKKRQIKSVLTGHTSPVVSVHFAATGDFFSGDDDGCIKLWSSKTYEAINIVDEEEAAERPNSLTKLSISHVAPTVAGVYDDGTVSVWDIGNGVNRIYNLTNHTGKVTDVSSSTKNARLLATVSLDEQVHLVDSGTTRLCSRINVEQPLTSISFHEDGMHCAVGTSDGTILVYDWRYTSAPVSITSAHEPFPVHALSFQTVRASSSTTVASAQSVGKEVNSLYTVETVRSAEKAPKIVAGLSESQQRKNSTTSVVVPPSAPSALRHSLVSSEEIRQPPPMRPNNLRSQVAHGVEEVDVVAAEEKGIDRPSSSSLRDNHTSTQRYGERGDLAYGRKLGGSVSIASVEQSVETAFSKEKVHHQTLSSQISAAVESSGSRFEDQYRERIQAYVEVGQDRIHRREREAAAEDNAEFSLTRREPDRTSGIPAHSLEDVADDFTSLREAVRPVTHRELEDAIELLKYDIHQEVQEIVREQVRQFSIAKVGRCKIL